MSTASKSSKHWYRQKFRVYEFTPGTWTIGGPHHKCLETTYQSIADGIVGYINEVYELGMARGRREALKDRRKKKRRKA